MAAGLGARDTLRLEAAMPLYGHELNESINPYQAGLGRAVNLKGRNFIGADELQSIQSSTPSAVRVGIQLDGRRAAREGAIVIDMDSRAIGTVTSGSFSPTLGYPIAMAYVDSNIASVGNNVELDIRGSKVPVGSFHYLFISESNIEHDKSTGETALREFARMGGYGRRHSDRGNIGVRSCRINRSCLHGSSFRWKDR